MLKLNYPMKDMVNLFGGNIIKNSFQNLAIPKPDITVFADASETGWDIIDGQNSSGGQCAEHKRMHVNVL